MYKPCPRRRAGGGWLGGLPRLEWPAPPTSSVLQPNPPQKTHHLAFLPFPSALTLPSSSKLPGGAPRPATLAKLTYPDTWRHASEAVCASKGCPRGWGLGW
eukprot:GHVR01065083.1.p3 GENE.GHVR01065083.1~~GHVR01065083.1.p3  ORF type:complete len:101 (+),score=22.10 GHVR01065083.1:200-502(+)